MQPPLRPGALVTPDSDTLTADVVIIGSGMGGGTLAWALKDAGLDVLIVERGQFLPRETENSQPDHVFIKKRYVTSKPWYDAKTGQPFQPGRVHPAPYPFPPLSHEPAIERFAVRLRQQGLHPFHMPNGMHLPSMAE